MSSMTFPTKCPHCGTAFRGGDESPYWDLSHDCLHTTVRCRDMLRTDNDRLRAALETIRDGMRDYSQRGMGQDLPCEFEVTRSTNKGLRRVIDAALSPKRRPEPQ